MKEEQEKAKKAITENKKIMDEINSKGFDNVKLSVAQLKNLICYHFWSIQYKDLKLWKNDLLAIVCTLIKDAAKKIIGEVLGEIILDFGSLSDGKASEDEDHDAEILEEV